MANFLFLKFQLYPMSNRWDIGSKCCCFGPRPRPYRPLFRQIKNFETILFAADVLKKFSPFCSISPEIIGVKVYKRQTDRQTDRQILWHHIQGYFILFYFIWSPLVRRHIFDRLLWSHIQGYVDFFSQSNLLPPKSLSSHWKIFVKKFINNP